MERMTTRFSRPEPRPHNTAPAVQTLRRPRGFTLVELLVVMGIMLVLAALLLPMVNRARREAARATMQADLITIGQALDQYEDTFGTYPQVGIGNTISGSSAQVTGAQVLCWALVAPGPASQDGAGKMNGSAIANPDNGAPGFRLHNGTQGKVYGPYINLDNFRIGTYSGTDSNQVVPVPSTTPFDNTNTVIADRNGNVILYWPVNPAKQSLFISQNVIGSNPPFTSVGSINYTDNAFFLTPPKGNFANDLTFRLFAYRLGNHAMTGTLKAGETAILPPYLLWSPGPDGNFGPPVQKGVTFGTDDDVTNVPLDDIPIGTKP